MKQAELSQLIKTAIEQVAKNGRDAARVYHAIVALDRKVYEQAQYIAELVERLESTVADTDPCRL